MKYLKITALIIATMFFMTGCMPPSATGIDEESIKFVQLEPMKDGEEIAVIETSQGVIKMRMFPAEAPKTVAHFKKLIGEGFYTDKEIHIDKNMKAAITGSIDEEGRKGKVVTDDGKALKMEINPNLWHFSGAVSVVGYEKSKFNKEMLSDSRFFVVGDVPATADMAKQMQEFKYPQKVIDAYKKNGGLPQYTGSYTVFGHIYEGMKVVDKIIALPIDEETGKAKDGVQIKKITLEKYTNEAVSQ